MNPLNDIKATNFDLLKAQKEADEKKRIEERQIIVLKEAKQIADKIIAAKDDYEPAITLTGWILPENKLVLETNGMIVNQRACQKYHASSPTRPHSTIISWECMCNMGTCKCPSERREIAQCGICKLMKKRCTKHG